MDVSDDLSISEPSSPLFVLCLNVLQRCRFVPHIRLFLMKPLKEFKPILLLNLLYVKLKLKYNDHDYMMK